MTAAAAVVPPPAAQRRIEAFCSPAGAEVFRSVVGHQEIWRSDPFDVETIHEEARAAFQRALNRAALKPAPPAGSVLLLLGVSGSGKTHLVTVHRVFCVLMYFYCVVYGSM